MAREQRRLAAIVCADVVGYSRLVGIDEIDTLCRLKALRAEVIDPRIVEHGGRIVKTTGDGLLVEFGSVVDAVRCTIAVQREIAQRDPDMPAPRRIAFRVGIHMGDIVIDGDDILGDGVNVAARLESLAEPGGVCVSGRVQEDLAGKLDVVLRDGGEQKLKNIARSVRIWRWLPGSISPTGSPVASALVPVSLPDKPSIAVLPFTNMSGDPEQEYFSDGITEDIITDLSKASGLFVIARNSSFVYKGKTFNVIDACRELGVRFALEGSIRKAANRIRITAQLIDGTSGGHLWAERYDRDLSDIFQVQDEVTQQIVDALRITLSAAEKSLIVSGGTTDVEAHDMFLRGRELMFGPRRDREMFERSMACFRRAVELDPNYAGAYAGLGMGHALDHQNHWSDAPEKSLDVARRLVDQAVAKDDKDPFAHYVAAVVAMWTKDYERWAHECDRALSLNPNFALALSTRGVLHIYTGEPTKALPLIERAMRLDPAGRHGQYAHWLGTAHYVAGDYELSANCFRDRIVANPTTDLSRAFLASALGHLGDVTGARRIWRELMEINPRYSATAHIGRLPFRNSADAERFIDGLRKAGLAA